VPMPPYPFPAFSCRLCFDNPLYDRLFENEPYVLYVC
jgi:hypothetical protein